MSKPLLFALGLFAFTNLNSQTIIASLNGTFVEGIIGVINTISVDTEATGTESVTFYSTDPTYPGLS